MKVDKTILDNWQLLNDKIKELSEEEVKQLLTIERNGQRRTQWMLRLFGRYNILRTVRERKEMLSE